MILFAHELPYVKKLGEFRQRWETAINLHEPLNVRRDGGSGIPVRVAFKWFSKSGIFMHATMLKLF
ncbi:MAG: hypothetical protein CVU91_06040 [Firmicutes bacterium HGW-Firmicutes-16]|nr:MAG: hypothetical protein CVU91_06040 [Firmicutes bacterium HGW-Firmicutes-16]